MFVWLSLFCWSSKSSCCCCCACLSLFPFPFEFEVDEDDFDFDFLPFEDGLEEDCSSTLVLLLRVLVAGIVKIVGGREREARSKVHLDYHHPINTQFNKRIDSSLN